MTYSFRDPDLEDVLALIVAMGILMLIGAAI
jgi:hypothetical protein